MIQCVCVCACGGRVWSVSTDDTRGGGVMIKMVDIILSGGVGRRQAEKVRVSTLMLFFPGPLTSHAAVY